MGVHAHQPRHVQLTSSRNPRQQITSKTLGPGRILPMPIHSRTLATRVAPHHILPCRGRFWNQDSRIKTRKTFASGTREVLRLLDGLEGRIILWCTPGLGLQEPNSSSLSAHVRTQCSHQIWTPKTFPSAIFPIPSHPNPIWFKTATATN